MNDDLWVEVDLESLRHNLRQVKSLISEETRILAVVKANGYGHGCVEPAKAFVDAGAWGLGVTRLDEALSLRAGGVEEPVLVFAPILRENAAEAVDARLDLTVDALPIAQAISEAASKQGVQSRLHVKVDTGMGRIGVHPKDVLDLCRAVAQMPNVEIAGLYTHFADASARNPQRTMDQLSTFMAVRDRLRSEGIDYGAAHAANSAAAIRFPDSRLDMVRPGTILYGQYPSVSMPNRPDLRPTWTLKARVCSIKTVGPGQLIGYGGEYKTRRVTRIALLPVGYADGYTLAPDGPFYRQSLLKFAVRRTSHVRSVTIRGRQARILGRVSMQICCADVTDIPGVELGDEAVIPAMRIPTSPLIRRVYTDAAF